MINAEILEYCMQQSDSDSSYLKSLAEHTQKTEEFSQMISGNMVGHVLQTLIRLSGAKQIIEVGTFTGYSALKMAEALPLDGHITTCELLEKHVETAGNFFKDSDYAEQITILEGPALETLQTLPAGQFDMGFIDANKSDYPQYYKLCITLLKQNGVLVLDNMLWSGTVLDPQDNDSKILRATADLIKDDPRVFNFLLPVRDGLMICIKK